jgi:hypothetical protein
MAPIYKLTVKVTLTANEAESRDLIGVAPLREKHHVDVITALFGEAGHTFESANYRELESMRRALEEQLNDLATYWQNAEAALKEQRRDLRGSTAGI